MTVDERGDPNRGTVPFLLQRLSLEFKEQEGWKSKRYPPDHCKKITGVLYLNNPQAGESCTRLRSYRHLNTLRS